MPSFTSFLPSPFLTCFAILLKSIGSKGPHLRRELVAQPSSNGHLDEIFRGFPIRKGNARKPVASHRYDIIINLILAD